jgi:hypothetical protein
MPSVYKNSFSQNIYSSYFFLKTPNSGRNCLLSETLSLDGSFSSSVLCGLRYLHFLLSATHYASTGTLGQLALLCIDTQCCRSGMFIPDLVSRIQNQQQKRGKKKFVIIPFFVATYFTKLKIILFLKC